jgi:hypothetical protein
LDKRSGSRHDVIGQAMAVAIITGSGGLVGSESVRRLEATLWQADDSNVERWSALPA